MCFSTEYRKIKRAVRASLLSARGQATVEAAYLIPVLFLLLLILCQPAILLYNRMVMEGAAAESVRLLATRPNQGLYEQDKYVGYVKRRLAAVPPIAIFHLGQEAAQTQGGWTVDLAGDENSATVNVRLSHRVQPLPLIGWGANLIGMCDSEGYIVQEVEAHGSSQADWVVNNTAGGPSDWTKQWL